MGKKRGYTSEDAWRDTDETRDATKATWHQARTDDQRSNKPSADYGDRKATDADYRPSWDSGKGGERASDSGKDSGSDSKK